MFRLREEHAAARADEIVADVMRMQCKRLRQNFLDRLARLDDFELERLVKKRVDNAYCIGIVQDQDLSRFLDFTVLSSENFEADRGLHVWVDPVLNNVDIDPCLRLDILYSFLERRLFRGGSGFFIP